MVSILIVEDDSSMRLTLSMLLEQEGFTVSEAHGVGPAIEKIEQGIYDIVIIDLRLEDGDGKDILLALQKTSPGTEAIIVTGYGTIRSAVELIKGGAFDYLAKPIEPDELLLTIHRAMERKNLQREVRWLREQIREKQTPDGPVVASVKMQRVLDLAARVARTDATVLIQGESRTGKEVVASAIHQWSHRAKRPFVAIDCATLPEPLLESELFGHVKGAFTGAIVAKKGLFEEGEGGTIFLDEVEAMPPSTQVKLLRVLQDRVIRRVGGTNPSQIDVRILAATNQELKSFVEKRAFRADPYYRLNGIVLTIPPLREQGEGDIMALANHFLTKYSRQVGRGVDGISSAAMEILLRYPWPGNVRELEKCIEHALIFGRANLVAPEDLPPRLLGASDLHAVPPYTQRSLAEVEKAHVLTILSEHGWNHTKAAAALGISRTTLWRKLRHWDINFRIPE